MNNKLYTQSEVNEVVSKEREAILKIIDEKIDRMLRERHSSNEARWALQEVQWWLDRHR